MMNFAQKSAHGVAALKLIPSYSGIKFRMSSTEMLYA